MAGQGKGKFQQICEMSEKNLKALQLTNISDVGTVCGTQHCQPEADPRPDRREKTRWRESGKVGGKPFEDLPEACCVKLFMFGQFERVDNLIDKHVWSRSLKLYLFVNFSSAGSMTSSKTLA